MCRLCCSVTSNASCSCRGLQQKVAILMNYISNCLTKASNADKHLVWVLLFIVVYCVLFPASAVHKHFQASVEFPFPLSILMHVQSVCSACSDGLMFQRCVQIINLFYLKHVCSYRISYSRFPACSSVEFDSCVWTLDVSHLHARLVPLQRRGEAWRSDWCRSC